MSEYEFDYSDPDPLGVLIGEQDYSGDGAYPAEPAEPVAPGWEPSPEQADAARAAVEAYETQLAASVSEAEERLGKQAAQDLFRQVAGDKADAVDFDAVVSAVDDLVRRGEVVDVATARKAIAEQVDKQTAPPKTYDEAIRRAGDRAKRAERRSK